MLTHAALIDRARVARRWRAERHRRGLAYLPQAWIGQHHVGFVQPMVVGYCICCPKSSETMLADMREIGPTYFLATPRVLEALLTQVTIRWRIRAGSINACMRRHGSGAWR